MKEYTESSHFLGTLKKSFIERDEIINFKKRFLDRKKDVIKYPNVQVYSSIAVNFGHHFGSATFDRSF